MNKLITPKKYKCTSRIFKYWIKALESGKYIQAQESLYGPVDEYNSDEYGYCCLGVFERVNGTNVSDMLGFGLPSDMYNDGFKAHRLTLVDRKTGESIAVWPEDMMIRRNKKKYVRPAEANDDYAWNFQQIAAGLREYLE